MITSVKEMLFFYVLRYFCVFLELSRLFDFVNAVEHCVNCIFF